MRKDISIFFNSLNSLTVILSLKKSKIDSNTIAFIAFYFTVLAKLMKYIFCYQLNLIQYDYLQYFFIRVCSVRSPQFSKLTFEIVYSWITEYFKHFYSSMSLRKIKTNSIKLFNDVFFSFEILSTLLVNSSIRKSEILRPCFV